MCEDSPEKDLPTAIISFMSQLILIVWDLTLNSAAWHSGQTASSLLTITFLTVTCSILQAKILIIWSARESVIRRCWKDVCTKLPTHGHVKQEWLLRMTPSCTAPPLYASSFHTLLQTGISFSDVKFKPWFSHMQFPQIDWDEIFHGCVQVAGAHHTCPAFEKEGRLKRSTTPVGLSRKRTGPNTNHNNSQHLNQLNQQLPETHHGLGHRLHHHQELGKAPAERPHRPRGPRGPNIQIYAASHLTCEVLTLVTVISSKGVKTSTSLSKSWYLQLPQVHGVPCQVPTQYPHMAADRWHMQKTPLTRI